MGEQARRLGLDNFNRHERGCSRGTVRAHLDRLRHRGLITESATGSSPWFAASWPAAPQRTTEGMDAPFIPAEAGMYMSVTTVLPRLAVQSLESS
jgi:hypothetical protein